MARKEKMNPNSLANLKPIKKGEIKNPEGARAHDPHKKILKNFTNAFLREIIDLAMMGNLDQLAKFIADPDTPSIQVGVAKVLHNAIVDGNWTLIEQLLARIIGKVPDKLDVTSMGQKMEAPGVRITFVDPVKK